MERAMKPLSIADMIESSRLDATRDPILRVLRQLLVGVTVEGHYGKLDINDVVAKTIVKAPGVMLGWTGLRDEREIDGRARQIIDWSAYIVVEEHTDIAAKRRIPRDQVAHAIGSRILDILRDPETASWGLTDIDRPMPEPAPRFVPVFTTKSWTEGAAIYAVTWSQALWDVGEGFFDRGDVTVRQGADGLPEIHDDEDDEQTEILAMVRRAEEGDEA